MKISKQVEITTEDMLEFIKDAFGYKGCNISQLIFSAREANESEVEVLETKMMEAGAKYQTILNKAKKDEEKGGQKSFENEIMDACDEWYDALENYTIQIIKNLFKFYEED